MITLKKIINIKKLKKILCISIFCLTSLLLVALPPAKSSFAASPNTLRIGLSNSYQNDVTVSNDSLAFGVEDNAQLTDCGTLITNSRFIASRAKTFFVVLPQSYSSYDKAATQCKAMSSYKAAPAYEGSGIWKVYLYFDSLLQADEAAETAKLFTGAKTISPGASAVVLREEEKTLLVANGANFWIADSAGLPILINDSSYRGKIAFSSSKSGIMTAVNIVSMEDYLRGVVPAEMPANYGIEALKAQACAARTYAAAKINNHISQGFHLCDTTHCQVYQGTSLENDITTEAVSATKGQLITYQNQPIEAMFFSSSGGYTDSSANVWAESPYLRSVAEINEKDPSVWTRTVTAEQLYQASNGSIGQIRDVLFTQDPMSCRVQSMVLIGTSGNQELKKEEIRTFFSSIGGSLPSRMFTINGAGAFPAASSATAQQPNSVYVLGANGAALEAQSQLYAVGRSGEISVWDDSSQISILAANSSEKNAGGSSVSNAIAQGISTSLGTGVFTIQGKGSGHGVGMSQKGARGMADLGYTYKDILKHYYTGVTIQ